MRPSADEATLRFYNEEAGQYCERTGLFSLPKLAEFLSLLPAGAAILELGCGSGRDTAEMIRLGYDVTPTDGSPEIVRKAAQRLNRPVGVLEFSDLHEEGRFDGVWAQACLLHVPITHLSEVLTQIYRALRSPGLLFASFKAGTGEGRDRFGRYYNYPSLRYCGEHLRKLHLGMYWKYRTVQAGVTTEHQPLGLNVRRLDAGKETNHLPPNH